MKGLNLDYQPQILVDTSGLSEDKWLEYRKKGIGGSDASAVLGISPFKTCRDLYYEKIGQEKVNELPENWVAMRIGNLLEDLVAEIFAKQTGYKVIKDKRMYYHPLYPHMLANLDYIIELPDGKRNILEIKTTSYFGADAWDNDAIPEHYKAQGRHYMAVTNMNGVYFACLSGNKESDLMIRFMERDLLLESELIFNEKWFWEENVLEKAPPVYTEAAELVERSLKMYVGSGDKTLPGIELDTSLQANIEKYLALGELQTKLNKQLKVVKEAMKQSSFPITEILGKRCAAIMPLDTGIYNISYNPICKPIISKEKLNWLKSQYPDIYDEIVSYIEYRTFSAKFSVNDESKNKAA